MTRYAFLPLASLLLLACSSTHRPSGDGGGGDDAPSCGACRYDGGPDDADRPDPSDAGPSDAGPREPITCGELTCGSDEYCVNPCCGGAPPMCLPENPDGTCPPGTTEGMCWDPGGPGYGCTSTCTPPPAFCAPLSACDGDDCPPPGGSCYGGFYDAATRIYSCLCA